MKIREIYKSEPGNHRYTIYRGEEPKPFHDSGIPMGTDIPRKAFMRGVPSKLINHIMTKLEKEVPSENFYTELEEGFPDFSRMSPYNDHNDRNCSLCKGSGNEKSYDELNNKPGHIYIQKPRPKCPRCDGTGKKAAHLHSMPDEGIDEAPMGPIAKGLATAAATASMAGGVNADPGGDHEKYGTDIKANPEYNVPDKPGDNTPVPKVNLKQYEKPIKQLAVNFMKQQKYFSGIWPKGTTGPYITNSKGKVAMATKEIGKNYIVLSTRYREASLGAAPPNAMNGAEITIRFGDYSRGEPLPGMNNAYSINKPSPTTITSVRLNVLNDGPLDVARYAYKKFTGKIPHLSDQEYTKPGEMQAAGFYDLIGKDISKIK